VTSATSDRRARIADAAIATLARDGMRGFTHRAVDKTAGLPEGSTSYYFRTRQVLLLAALERMTELDTADVAAPMATDLDSAAELVVGVLEHWLTAGRERTLARYEFTLEAARRPELRARLISDGARFRVLAARLLAGLGADEPERKGRDLVAYLEGLAFDHLVGAGERDLLEIRVACRELLAALVG
jgi:DNA-binding transcriptional regulator YbjK